MSAEDIPRSLNIRDYVIIYNPANNPTINLNKINPFSINIEVVFSFQKNLGRLPFKKIEVVFHFFIDYNL